MSRANWLGSPPASVIAVSVTGSVPLLVIVEVWLAVGPSSMSRSPNASATGLRESSVCVPVPVSGNV